MRSVTRQLDRARSLGILPHSDASADEQAAIWTETLRDAGLRFSDDVDESFKRAISAHKFGRGLAISEVIREWHELRQAQSQNARAAHHNGCADCDGRGFIPNHSHRENGIDYTGVAVCSDCAEGQAKRRALENFHRLNNH